MAAATIAAWGFTGMAAADEPIGPAPSAVPRVGATAPAELRIGAADAHDRWSVVADATREPWDPFEAIPATLAAIAPRFDLRDALGGEARRARLAFDWLGSMPGARLGLNVHALRSEIELDPDAGPAASALDERFRQRDRRTAFGAALAASDARGILGLPGTRWVRLRTASDSLDARDSLGNAFHGGVRNLRDDRFREATTAFAASQHLELLHGLRFETAGEIRRYALGADSGEPHRAAHLDGTLASWRTALALSIAPGAELFARAARGEPDRDGPLALRDPRTGAALAHLDPAATATVVEAGWRGRPGAGLDATVSAFRAGSASEVRFSGLDAWSAIARPGLRSGVRAALRYEPAPWLALDLDATVLRARFGDGAVEPIPGAATRLATAGATLRAARGWTASLFVSYLGPRSAVEDDALRQRSSSVVNARLAGSLTRTTRITFDVFNVFNRRVGDFDPFAAARLAPQAGSMDSYLFHPGEPRGLRLRLRTTF